MAEPTLYLIDGYNVLHAGDFRSRDELVDRLASFVALRGVRGVVVFDGVGSDATHGRLEVRYAHPADPLLERLAAEHRGRERVCLVSSDAEIRQTAGQEVAMRASNTFAAELAGAPPPPPPARERTTVEDALDETTRERLEEWRRRRA
jgi:predicted RNA-binding protein with PIN domain